MNDDGKSYLKQLEDIRFIMFDICRCTIPGLSKTFDEIKQSLERLEKLENVVEILKKQLVFRYRQDDVLEIHKDVWRKNHPKIVLATSWDEDVLLKEVFGNENS